MGINVGSANNRAAELRNYASQLRAAKTALAQYENTIMCHWQGRETAYYRQAIESVRNKLESASRELESVAGAVTSTANQIRADEIEEERRRREEEERRCREEEERRRREEEQAAAETAQRASSSISRQCF